MHWPRNRLKDDGPWKRDFKALRPEFLKLLQVQEKCLLSLCARHLVYASHKTESGLTRRKDRVDCKPWKVTLLNQLDVEEMHL